MFNTIFQTKIETYQPYCQCFLKERFMKLNKDKKGTGLGLPISPTIASKLGGQIGADSYKMKVLYSNLQPFIKNTTNHDNKFDFIKSFN